MPDTEKNEGSYKYVTFGLKWTDADKWNWTQYDGPLNINLKKDQTAFEKGSEHKNLVVVPKVVYLYELFRKEISSSEYDSPENGFSFPFFQADLNKIKYTSPFGNRASTGTFHGGVDLACDAGVEIHAIADGTICHVESGASSGNCIAIKHNNGKISIYCHMNENPKYSVGNSVKKGDVVGHVGYTGHCIPNGPDGAHLHFQINNKLSGGFNNGAEDPCIYFTRLSGKLGHFLA